MGTAWSRAEKWEEGLKNLRAKESFKVQRLFGHFQGRMSSKPATKTLGATSAGRTLAWRRISFALTVTPPFAGDVLDADHPGGCHEPHSLATIVKGEGGVSNSNPFVR